MISNLQTEAFDLVSTLNDMSDSWDISLLAIDNRICEIEMTAKKNLGFGLHKGDTIVRDNVTYKEAVKFLKGLQWGLVLPSEKL